MQEVNDKSKDGVMRPVLSIVIANYNYGCFLEEAIQSVIAQDMGDRVELIVCDAASTDNSVEVIKKYANGLQPNTSYDEWTSHNNSQFKTPNPQLITWWCSEPDGGQSAAFNKGFSHAHGRFLTWLNADDVLMPGTLKAFDRAVAEHPECKWFVGGVMWLTKDMRIIKMGRGRHFSHIRAKAGSIGVWGPSSIFSRELFEAAGGVDERFHYAMDNDLWHRFHYKCGETYLPFIDYAWGLRLHELAKMSGHNFAPDGSFREGEAEQLEKESKKAKQLALEGAWMEELYKPKHPMNKWKQLISMSVYKSLAARIDTMRYKGRHYLEYYR